MTDRAIACSALRLGILQASLGRFQQSMALNSGTVRVKAHLALLGGLEVLC